MVEDDHRGLYVQSFPVPGDKYQVTIDDPVGAVWGDRGDEIVVLNDKNTLYSIKVSTAGGFQQGATTRLFTTAREDFFADVEARRAALSSRDAQGCPPRRSSMSCWAGRDCWRGSDARVRHEARPPTK